jgi:hypothetical protein
MDSVGGLAGWRAGSFSAGLKHFTELIDPRIWGLGKLAPELPHTSSNMQICCWAAFGRPPTAFIVAYGSNACSPTRLPLAARLSKTGPPSCPSRISRCALSLQVVSTIEFVRSENAS